MEDEALKAFKDLAVQSFIPKALIVCTLGNLINFVILSRPCIRSSLNVYLTILSFADILFMVLIYVSSKQYHEDVHHSTYEVYWRMFGLSHWFYTAFMYITFYLTLSLTSDRYDAVSHPARTRCGIVRAKNVVSMILFACFLFSISAAFEFQLVSEEYKNDELCNSNNRSQTVTRNVTMMPSYSTPSAADETQLGDNEKSLNLVKRNNSSYNFNEDESSSRLERSLDNDVFSTSINLTDDFFDYSKLNHKTSYNPADGDHYVNDVERDNAPSGDIPGKRNHNTCSTHFYLYPVESALAKNKLYRIFKMIASVLLALPVVAITVLCCLLTVSMLRIKKIRQGLARLPTIVSRPEKEKTQADVLIRENRLALLVITLAVIFLICDTPNAFFSLYKSWQNNRQTFPEQKKIKNFILALEISCQILMAINSCSKIFVYLLTYDEYWKSLRSLKSCGKCTNGSGEQMINTSKHLFPSTKADVESLLNYSLNKKRYCTEIPPEARHRQHTIPIPRTHKTSFSNSISTTNNSITPRLSLTPSDAEGMEMSRRVTNQISTLTQVERQPSMKSTLSFKALQLSPSQTSLTRSKSLNIQSTMKHSPNCRLNKNFLN